MQPPSESRQLIVGAAVGIVFSLFSQVGVALAAGSPLSLPVASAVPLAIVSAITGALFRRITHRGVVGAGK
jgi:uncharacterized membrane protein (DUF441 family)